MASIMSRPQYVEMLEIYSILRLFAFTAFLSDYSGHFYWASNFFLWNSWHCIDATVSLWSHDIWHHNGGHDITMAFHWPLSPCRVGCHKGHFKSQTKLYLTSVSLVTVKHKMSIGIFISVLFCVGYNEDWFPILSNIISAIRWWTCGN